MSTFKTVKNTRTGKQFCYIDGKRVSQNKYNDKYTLCKVQNKQMHSLWTCIDDKAGYIRAGFCFD